MYSGSGSNFNFNFNFNINDPSPIPYFQIEFLYSYCHIEGLTQPASDKAFHPWHEDYHLQRVMTTI